MRGEDRFKRNKAKALVKRNPPLESVWDFDTGETFLTIRWVADNNSKIERQIRDVREWVTGINRQRRKYREDTAAKPLGDHVSLVAGQIIELKQFDVHLVESGQNLSGKDLFLTCTKFKHHRADVFNLLARSTAVGTYCGDTRGDLIMKPRHPHLKKLVEVAGINRQVANPLQERNFQVGGKFQDPAVERQPTHLAVQHSGVVNVPATNPNTHI